MNRRLRVLHSSFACEPGQGSEPEVGWRWALGMARYHDVTVLTQPKNRPAIELALAALPPEVPRPSFRYFDGGSFATGLRRRFGGLRLYYLWWQRAARKVIAELHEEIGFDLLHHVTFAGYRYSAAVWGQGVPCIWGPVGGMESVPPRLLPLDNPLALISELLRNASNWLQALPFHVLPRRAADSTVVLVSTRETQLAFESLGVATTLLPTIGIEAEAIGTHPIAAPVGRLELLFVGKLISLKGIDLAIRALHASGTDARLTFIGDGDYSEKARRLARRLGIESQIALPGRMPHAEVLREYGKFHVFVFPSLHDSGGFAVIEAMAQGLPVICLDCGGPAISVREGCGVRVPLERRGQVIAGLAAAIRGYDEDRAHVAADGGRARAAVEAHCEWGRKCEELRAIYAEASTEIEFRRASARRRIAHWASRRFVFTRRGLLLSALLVLLIAVAEVYSIRQLKQTAERVVSHTLPGLSSAALANESRNHSFIKMLLLLDPSRSEDHQKLIAQIEVLSRQTGAAFEQYEDAIRERADQENFRKLQAAREQYLRLRAEVLADIAANRLPEARERFVDSLLTAFEPYAEAADALTTYSVDAAKTDQANLQRLTVRSEIILAALGVAILGFGFLLGMSKT